MTETTEDEECEYAWVDLQKTSGVRDLSIERYYKVYEDCEVKLARYGRVDEDENDETRRRYCECLHILNDRFDEPEQDSVREIIWALFWSIDDYRARLCSDSDDPIHNEIIFEAILDLFVTM